MQRRFLFFLFVLAIAGAASIQSCKHSPLDILVEDPIEPIDTTGGGDTTQNPFSLLYNFFGFNGGANMRIGLDYGVTNWLTVGAGRSNLARTPRLKITLNITKTSFRSLNRSGSGLRKAFGF